MKDEQTSCQNSCTNREGQHHILVTCGPNIWFSDSTWNSNPSENLPLKNNLQ